MNRKGKGVSTVSVVLSLAAVALVVVAILALVGMNKTNQPASIAPQQTQSGAVVTPTGLVSCPSDGTTDGQIRYRDTLASTITYENPTVYFVSNSGLERVTAGTLQTDGTYSTAVNLKCTEAGTSWTPIAVTAQDDAASAVGTPFTAEGSMTKVDLQGKDIDTLKFKVEDKYTGGAKYFNITGIGADENTQNYVTFNGTQAAVTNVAAYTGTSLTLGTDGYIDARIYLKTNNTKRQFGEDGLRTFVLVDADGSSWSEPIVSRDGGAALVNVVDALSSDDRRMYSGYEYAYEVGSFTDKESYVDFYLQSASGVNPGASVDPIVEICAEGRYASVKEQDAIKIGCWTDAATQAAVFVSTRPYFKFDAS